MQKISDLKEKKLISSKRYECKKILYLILNKNSFL